MEVSKEFVDILQERRKDCDILWVSRHMDIQPPHNIPKELKYSRKQIIEAVLANPKVLSIIQTLSVLHGTPESELLKLAYNILNEMANKAHLPTARWLGILVTKVFKKILIRIKLNENYFISLKKQMTVSQVQYVYAPTHRSYLDFILVSYILFSYDMSLPNIASGMDFYNMKVIGELLKNVGAFYIRRSFATDPLYKELFKAYVNNLVAHSEKAIEFFIEGTRSRNQKTLSPKFGLLSTILETLLRSEVPDIQFIPISISYDKVLEELLFAYELLGVPKPPESTKGLFKSLSILKEPFAYGNVYMKVSPPISARKYLSYSTRKESSLLPNMKVPSQIVKEIAYDIVNCHKKNTVLSIFNLISLLYNNNMYINSKEYSLTKLINDFDWVENVLKKYFKVNINPNENNECDKILIERKKEILESLTTHKNLVTINSLNNLILLERHSGVSQLNGIKGYPLNQEILKVAVPVVNLMIYVNPIMGYLAKPAMCAIILNCIESLKDDAFKNYLILRNLLSIEFALPTDMSESDLLHEWQENVQLLLAIDCSRFNMLLCNLITPFIMGLFTICETLTQWNGSDNLIQKNILKECQRKIQELLQDPTSTIKHPYMLTLDMYAYSLNSLSLYEYINLDSSGLYTVNKISLLKVIEVLDNILQNCSHVNYMDHDFYPSSEEMNNLQSKL